MFKIEMLDSPDLNRVGSYQLFFNEINIGNSLDKQFVLDPLVKSEANIQLTVEENGAIYVTPEEIDSILVNGKKTNSKKKVSLGDTIEYAENKFKILEASFQKTEKLNDFLNQQFEKMKEEKSPFLKILKMLKD